MQKRKIDVRFMTIVLILILFRRVSMSYAGQIQPDITKDAIKSKQMGVNKKKIMAPGVKQATTFKNYTWRSYK